MPPTLRSALISATRVQELSGLTNEKLDSLKTTYGIERLQGLVILDPGDFELLLGSEAETFLVRKRLGVIVSYLKAGNEIPATMLMIDINPSTSSSSAQSSHPPASSPIKLSHNDIPLFSGDIEDQECYRTKIEAMVGQTAFKFLLTRDPSNSAEKEKDEELFNVFKASFHDGTAYHLITSALIDGAGNDIAPSG